MRVFRIGTALFTRSRQEAFSGDGGLYASARWHTAGRAVVYTAQSLSLAALEILVRLKQTNDIQPFYAYSAEVPDALILKRDSYPPRWNSRIAVSRAFGDAWFEAKTAPAMLVPTIITPGEWNVLINPLHPQFSSKWIVSGPEAYTFAARLLPAKSKTRCRKTSRPK
jgi:RES domain-containing protein